jgi:hypothetical protein
MTDDPATAIVAATAIFHAPIPIQFEQLLLILPIISAKCLIGCRLNDIAATCGDAMMLLKSRPTVPEDPSIGARWAIARQPLILAEAYMPSMNSDDCRRFWLIFSSLFAIDFSGLNDVFIAAARIAAQYTSDSHPFLRIRVRIRNWKQNGGKVGGLRA